MGIAERKQKEKLKRRNTIIRAAEKIFFAPGGDKGTMDDVASKVQLSKGTLYLYFKNKTDLQYALAEKGVLILSKLLKEAIIPQQNGRNQLSELGDFFVQFVEDYPKHFELILFFELSNPSGIISKKSTLLMGPALEVLHNVISNGQKDGSIRKDFSTNEIVIILWSQLLGILQNILHKETYMERFNADLSRIIKGHYKIIMKGIEPHS